MAPKIPLLWTNPNVGDVKAAKKWVVSSYLVNSGDERIPDCLDCLNPYSMLLFFEISRVHRSLNFQVLPLKFFILCCLKSNVCCLNPCVVLLKSPFLHELLRIPMFAATPSEVTLKISLKWLKLIGKWWWTIQFWGRLFLRQSLSKSPRPGHRSGRHFFISAIDDPILPRSVSMWPNHTGHHRSIGHLKDWTQRRIGGGTKKNLLVHDHDDDDDDSKWEKNVQTTITILNTFWDNSSNHQK